MMKKVSVIVPVYNVEKYIEECVQSIQNQTVKGIEIILVDDGSTDRSGEICEKLEEIDDRIFVIHQKNQGVSVARNVGIEKATTDWIMFVDSDDWLERDAVDKLLLVGEEKNCDMVFGAIINNYSLSEEDAKLLDSRVYTYEMKESRVEFQGACIIEPGFFKKVFPSEMQIMPFVGGPCAKIYRRSLFERGNFRFQKGVQYGEDSMFNMKMLSQAERIGFIHTPVYHYRMRAGSLSTGNGKNKFSEYIKYVEESEKCIEYLKIPRKEFSPYRTMDLVQMMWELCEIFGMMAKSGKDVSELSHNLREFVNMDECKTAIRNVKLKDLPGIKYQLIALFLKMRLYRISIFGCKVFYSIFSSKNRMSEQWERT